MSEKFEATIKTKNYSIALTMEEATYNQSDIHASIDFEGIGTKAVSKRYLDKECTYMNLLEELEELHTILKKGAITRTFLSDIYK